MTITKNVALTLTLILFAFAIKSQAQTPTIEVTTDNARTLFAVQGQAQAVHIEVFSPTGELVFETDVFGQAAEWRMVNDKGEHVADGVYLATIVVTDFLGKQRKRTEQIVVSSETQEQQTPAADSPAAIGPISGHGSTGKLSKFTGTNAIGDSVVTESANKVGVNITPGATLQVNAAQPLPLAANGTAATTLLQTTGGKGGNSTVGGGKTAGAGGSISLVAGNGGDAPAGSTRGKGGNITLQPGSTGAGAGTAGLNGNVLIGPTGIGNVGIGTASPASRLTVNGGIQILGEGNGISFPDGVIQSKAVTGTGTTGQIVKFTGPNSFGNSVMKENGGKIGIGTTAPLAKLDVRGDVFVGQTAVPDSATSPGNNLYLGDDGGGDPNNSYRLDAYNNNLYIVARRGKNSTAGTGIIFRTGRGCVFAPCTGFPGNESDRMIIDPWGNVGIGTTDLIGNLGLLNGRGLAIGDYNQNHGTKLPVDGSAFFSSNVEVGGSIGIGTPATAYLTVQANSNNSGENTATFKAPNIGSNQSHVHYGNTGDWYIRSAVSGGKVILQDTGGPVGIATAAPDMDLTVNGAADKPGGGSWSVYSDERLKTIKGRFTPGLKALMQLQPIRYEYRQNNALGINLTGEQVGFGAQAVQKIIPEAVSKTASGYLLVNNDPIMWTMLNAIKEQEQQITRQQATAKQQQDQIAALRTANTALNARLRLLERTLKTKHGSIRHRLARVQRAVKRRK